MKLAYFLRDVLRGSGSYVNHPIPWFLCNVFHNILAESMSLWHFLFVTYKFSCIQISRNRLHHGLHSPLILLSEFNFESNFSPFWSVFKMFTSINIHIRSMCKGGGWVEHFSLVRMMTN